MSNTKRIEYINRVKTRINEISADTELVYSVDIENDKPYDDLIDELLDESALFVLTMSPIYLLPISHIANAVVSNPADGEYSKINLPDDFIKIVSLRLKGWKRPIYSLSMAGSDIDTMQTNKFVQGGKNKPIGVLHNEVENGSTKRFVYCYPKADDGTDTIKEFNYIKKCKAEEILTDKAVEGMLWVCASKVLSILDKRAQSEQCLENAKSILI